MKKTKQQQQQNNNNNKKQKQKTKNKIEKPTLVHVLKIDKVNRLLN